MSSRLFSYRNLTLLLIVAIAVWWIARRDSRTLVSSQSAGELSTPSASPVLVTSASTNLVSIQKPFSFAQALDQSLLETDPIKRSQAFGLLLAKWFAENPESALAYVKEMKRNTEEYTLGMVYILTRFADNDPTRALQLAGEMATASGQKYIYNLLFNTIALRDAPSAVNYLSLVPVGEARNNAILSLTAIWSRRDLEGALQWAQSLPEKSDRTLAVETVLLDLTERDPNRSLALSSEYLSRDAADRITAAAMRQLTVSDISAAQALFVQLPDGQVKTDGALEITRVLAASDVNAALQWRLTLPEGSLRQTALNLALDALNQQDAAAARQYVVAMPSGSEQALAAKHLAYSLARNDPGDAIRWVDSLTDASTRSSAISGLTSSWVNQDPQAATQWAWQLAATDPSQTRALSETLSYWSATDADGASAFINSFPQAEQDRLNQMVLFKGRGNRLKSQNP